MTGIRVAKTVIERLEREARKLGLTLEEYVLDLLLRNLDPGERALGYIEVAKDMLEQAREELGGNRVREAAEKIWGAAVLAVKAYAELREGKRLTSHGELWEYKRRMEKEVGDWIYNVWAIAHSMHTCFYEGWCDKGDVGKALEEIAKLVEVVDKFVQSRL